jgi:arylsulfatase
VVKPGTIINDIMSHEDWMPTFLAAAGDPNIKERLLTGHQANGKSFKNHLDGYNFLPYLTGKEDKGPRREMFYFSDDGDLTALRFNDWKAIFMEQKTQGTLRVWMDPFVPLRLPLIFNLRRDPYERAEQTSNTYYDWMIDRLYVMYGAQAIVSKFVDTFKEFPPRQKAASFSIDQVVEKLKPPTH